MHELRSNNRMQLENTSKEPGLTIAFYGDGKGKTSAAIGTAVRSLMLNRRIAFLQFIKGDWQTNEELFFKSNKDVVFEKLGNGFVNGNFLKHKSSCSLALQRASAVLKDGFDLVILDEILTAFELDLIDEKQILRVITAKPIKCDLVLTGRKMSETIIKECDIVTQMKKKKHIFDKGTLAKNGIDF